MHCSSSPPLVTLITLTCDRPSFLRQAIRAAASQDYKGPIELLVVDDGPRVPISVAAFPEATSRLTVNIIRPRTDVSYLLRETIAKGGKVLLEGPQSYFLSNAAEKFWDSGTSACTDAAGLLCASRLNLQAGGPNGSVVRPLTINIHKTPGSSRVRHMTRSLLHTLSPPHSLTPSFPLPLSRPSLQVGSGANPCSFVPQHYFSATGASKDDFEAMKLDWRTVSREYFGSVQQNGLLMPGTHTNAVGTFDLGVAMAAATCIHPSHREFGVTSGRPRVVGFFDCVAQAEVMQVQGPYTSISAFVSERAREEHNATHGPQTPQSHSCSPPLCANLCVFAGPRR